MPFWGKSLYREEEVTVLIQKDAGFELQGLRSAANGFDARFIAAANLHALARRRPDMIDNEGIDTMKAALMDVTILRQRQSYFLCREVARALTLVYAAGRDRHPYSDYAISALKSIIQGSTGPSHRAVTEALGALPVGLLPPVVECRAVLKPPKVGWPELATQYGIKGKNNTLYMGRSLVTPIPDTNRALVIKLGTAKDTPEGLSQESVWMEFLRSSRYLFPDRFDIPCPITINGYAVFCLVDLPMRPSRNLGIHSDGIAVGFVTDRDYFCYPNQPTEDRKGLLPPACFIEVMEQNSRLLGFLAGRGIIHTAPIPLFHNRVQQERRTDHGVYDWPLAGRLDRWLDSCQYPNLGTTGIRDFEHFQTITATNSQLYWYIGMHLLSLLLVAASYFRNRDPERKGRDRAGNPLDARDLFDAQLLRKLVVAIFHGYYHGFVEQEAIDEMPFHVERLVNRMIEEMGFDYHMEEVLRAVDQQRMDDESFREFLQEKGYSDREAAGTEKGARDVIILTGPHLGGFNQSISLPELIDAVASMAASCIVGRHRQNP